MDTVDSEGVAPAVKGERAFFARPYRSLEEFDLRQLLRKLWRRRGIILGTMTVLTVLTAIIVFQLTPRYTAAGLLIIETRGGNVATDVEAVLSGLSADAATIQSEIEVLRSRGLAGKTVNRLNLDRNPEFNQALRSKGLLAEFLDPARYFPKEWLTVFLRRADDKPLTEEDRRAQEKVRITNTFLKSLKVSPKGRSRVIVVEFTSEDSKTAAEVVNTHADLYIVEQLEVKFEATRRATAWLNERVVGLRRQVKETERAVEVFRQRSGLFEGPGEGVTLNAQELSELNTQLILARTARAEAKARFQQVQVLVSSAGSVNSAAEVLQSALIQNLREQEAEVERKVAELSGEYGERHPTMINARAEARDLENKIRTEVNKIVKGLENEVNVMRVRETTLRTNLEDMKKRAAHANKASIQLRALEREATANRTLLEAFLSRFKETSAQEDLNAQTPDARIISLAEIPDTPAFPKKRLIIALAFMGSTLIGLMLAFAVEQLDAGFRSGEQIEQATGMPVLGLVPMLTGLDAIGRSPATYILEHPRSAFGESIRTLNTSILLFRVDAPPKTILITSSLPKEGKTMLSVSLARLRGTAGQKVIVIDADIRRPNIHRVFGTALQPGLTELLAGQASLEEVVRKDEATNAHFIPAGRSVPNPSDLLGSEQMKKYIDGLTKIYDLIVFDSPPVLAVSDARILSNAVDMTVFVVRWAHTRREVVNQGLKQIITSGGHLAGVVLSLVDAKKHARYGFADSGYYYGRVKKYYTS